ncbi:YtxH domain-containing protein [Salibacterium lacus]|uniref:YtxH domain-containing protein n=1 Tax=Salibacterium lacus TaxID=1898109 RepID=A0ABW5T0Q5_9BACI
MNKQIRWISAAAGFFSAFAATLLTAPQNGKTTRRQIARLWGWTINVPSKVNAAYRGRRDKTYEYGRGRYKQWTEDLNALKKEAKQSAKDANDES